MLKNVSKSELFKNAHRIARARKLYNPAVKYSKLLSSALKAGYKASRAVLETYRGVETSLLFRNFFQPTKQTTQNTEIKNEVVTEMEIDFSIL